VNLGYSYLPHGGAKGPILNCGFVQFTIQGLSSEDSSMTRRECEGRGSKLIKDDGQPRRRLANRQRQDLRSGSHGLPTFGATNTPQQ
jgi:hypothetical protein